MSNPPPGFSYVARRVLAALLDYGLYFAILVGYSHLFGSLDDDGNYRVDGCLHFLILFLIWVVLLPLPEALWGRGLGKLVCELRVTMRARLGAPPDLGAVVKRHLTAFLEFGMCMGVLPLIVVFSTPSRQRLGDLWAGTLVIDDDGPGPETRTVG